MSPAFPLAFALARPVIIADTAGTVAATGSRIAIVLALAFAGWFMARRAIDRGRRRVADRTIEADRVAEIERMRAATRADTISSVLSAIVTVVIWSIAGLTVLGEIGIGLAPLIAGAGIIGVAIGFGAQSLVADFLSGLFMLVEDQYGVGDFVDVGEAAGIVEHVGLRTTKIRDLDGLLWTVRNGEIVRTGNGNQRWGRSVLDIGVAYDADVRKAAEVIKRAADECHADPEHTDKFLDEPEIWGIQALGDDAVIIRLVCKSQPGLQWGLARELRLRVKEALDEAEIEIPFPQRTTWIRTEPETLSEPIPLAVGNGERDERSRPDDPGWRSR